MISFLPPFVRGVVTFFSYVVFTIALSLIFFVVAAVKFAVPHPSVRRETSRVLDWIASGMWVKCAIWTHRFTGRIDWDIRGETDFSIDRWCLILSNHQSWVDILVIIHVLAGRVPPYKFFVKRELLWVPFFGQCLWGLDFPVMKRYSKAYLEKHPHLKGRDLETARRSCQKFKHTPVSIMNFVEGTRFTSEKHARQASPFNHLLKPRAGGLAMAVYAMGDLLDPIVDLTIAYPEGVPGLWDFFCGRTSRVSVDVRLKRIPDALRQGNDFSDADSRDRLNEWLNALWEEKDRTLAGLLAE